MCFIYGPKYKKTKKESHVLLNFLFGQVKLAIWLSRKEKLSDNESCEVDSVLKGLIRSQLSIHIVNWLMTLKRLNINGV